MTPFAGTVIDTDIAGGRCTRSVHVHVHNIFIHVHIGAAVIQFLDAHIEIVIVA